MRRESMLPVVISILLLLCPPSGHGQQSSGSCKAYLTMYVYDENLGLILAPGMTADQSKWFEKKGKKKYSGLCLSRDLATYVLVTVRWTQSTQQTVPTTKSALTTGPVTSVEGMTSGGPGQPAEPIWRTQLGTFVTTWQENETRAIREPHALILVFQTKDGNRLSQTSELRRDPILTAKGIGREGARDALEFVFRNWDLRLTERTQ